MHHFDLSLQEEIQIYINSGLTPTELFILRLLYLAIDDNPKQLVNYVSNTGNGKQVLRSVLESLKEKKVINSTYTIPKDGEVLNFKNIPFNKNFLKMYVRESHEIGKELFDAYPSFININGKLCSIKNFTKGNLYSLEEFCIYYSKSIKNSGVTHERVMECLNWAKDNNIINYSILEFIASMKWLEIEEIRKEGVNNFNSDIITCI